MLHIVWEIVSCPSCFYYAYAHSTGRLSCYEHRVVRSDTRSRVFAYYECITRCPCHATAPSIKHTKTARTRNYIPYCSNIFLPSLAAKSSYSAILHTCYLLKIAHELYYILSTEDSTWVIYILSTEDRTWIILHILFTEDSIVIMLHTCYLLKIAHLS